MHLIVTRHSVNDNVIAIQGLAQSAAEIRKHCCNGTRCEGKQCYDMHVELK